MPVRDIVPHDAGGITGTSVSTFDIRGISFGYRPQFLIDYFNLEPLKENRWDAIFADGPQRGYFTINMSNVKERYPETYDLLYAPYGFTHGKQTVFFDAHGTNIGVYAIIKKDEKPYRESERLLFDSISPYLFYSFMRYRWLHGIGFFTVSSLDDLVVGVVTADKKGRISWMNRAARDIFKKTRQEIPHKMTKCMKSSLESLRSVSVEKVDLSFAYREIDHVCDYGRMTAFRFDHYGAQHLPLDDEGTVFFLDANMVDRKISSRLTRREVEVMGLITKGMGDAEIARNLSISEKTVQIYNQNIFKKLEVKNRTEAAVKAVRLGLV